MTESKAIQIDVGKVLASKLGSKSWLVPGFIVKWLESTICQETLNEKLRLYHPKRGAEFCDAVMDDFKIDLDVLHAERWPELDKRRVIFVCNHPLGGLDGVSLISLLCRRYGPGVRFVVNDLLMALEPLRDVFLPINKHGNQSRGAIQDINAAMEGPDPILIFPAGLVSRQDSHGVIKDLAWNKMFVSKALQYERDVVPLYFSGRNSQSFYSLARRRKRWGLKFNIEMLYLPREVLAAKGSKYQVTVGERIPYHLLSKSKPSEMAQAVKELVYRLANG